MPKSLGNRAAAAAPSSDIAIQDAKSLLNLAGGLSDPSQLEIRKNRLSGKPNPQIGSVFDVCRTKPPEFLCTFNTTKKRQVVQHWFCCSTCSFSGPNGGLCTVCVNTCHKGHKVEYVGNSRFFCSCGGGKGDSPCVALTGKGETTSLLCTFKETGKKKTEQHSFRCYTCDLNGKLGICTSCVNICHKGHDVRYVKLSPRFNCDCGRQGDCKAMAI